jgi:hypothetical protein
LCTVRLSVRLSQNLSQHEIGHHEATHVITDRSCWNCQLSILDENLSLLANNIEPGHLQRTFVDYRPSNKILYGFLQEQMSIK